MSKDKRSRAQRKRRRSSGLDDHQRHKKTLTPPMMSIPNMRSANWAADMLPDFLWLRAVSEETADLASTHEPLDLLDEFVDDTAEDREPPPTESGREMHVPTHLDGRISTFSLVPEERRAEARDMLRRHAPWALPDGFIHALALYPECPAAWLGIDGLPGTSADPEVGIGYLKRLVAPLLDPRGRPSSQVRLLPIARMAKHGKLHLQAGMEIVELLPRYPTRLGEEDRLHVEQWARASWMAFSMTLDRRTADAWANYSGATTGTCRGANLLRL